MKNYHCIFQILLVTIGLGVYFPILSNQFQLGWDDGWMLMNHYTREGFTWNNLRAMFTETWYGQYSPVNQLLYTLIACLFGFSPVAYHTYSLLLHLANACLVYFLIYRILKYTNRADEKTACIVSFFAGMLFCIHPLQIESVAWISASKVVLYSFFTLLAFLAYLKYVCTEKTGYYILTLAFFIFAFGSKEQSVVLPVSLILLDWVMKRNLKDADLWIEKLPFFLFAVFFGLFTLTMQSPELVQNWAGYTLMQRLVLACYAVVEYVVKLAFPVKLLYIYPFPMLPGEALPLRMLIYPVIVLVAGIGLFLYRKNQLLIFGVLFFLLNIALTLHIAPMSRVNIVADRYVYLPSVGLFFVGVWYAFSYMQTIIKKRLPWLYTLAVCYLLYFGVYAHQRTKVWYDSETLKTEMQELIEHNINAQEEMKNGGKK